MYSFKFCYKMKTLDALFHWYGNSWQPAAYVILGLIWYITHMKKSVQYMDCRKEHWRYFRSDIREHKFYLTFTLLHKELRLILSLIHVSLLSDKLNYRSTLTFLCNRAKVIVNVGLKHKKGKLFHLCRFYCTTSHYYE